MNVFFGRISVNQEPKDQYSKGYYKADRGSSYFGELNSIADFKKEPTYVFMIGGTSVELWKAREWDKLGKSLLFDKVKVNLEGVNRAWLAAFKYFFLDKNLIVFTTRRPFKKAFFKLKVDESFTEKLLLNDSTYADDGNYRNIEIHKSIPSENSRNIILYKEDNKWEFKAPDFFDIELEKEFRDNMSRIGHGRKNKDSILKKVRDNKVFPSKLDADSLTLLNIYDAFFCDYNGSIDDEILLKNDENLYKISMSPKDVSNEDYKHLIENNLVVVHRETKAIAKSHEKQGDRFRNSIKIGDYFYLCRGNKRIELIGKFISDAKPCEIKALGEEGWIQRKFELINECDIDESYSGENKWWTPNYNSTCIQIPDEEIPISNDLLFIPFFGTLVKKESYEGSISGSLIQSNENSRKMNLNTILYGPPGTGKTFHSITYAVAIIDDQNPDTLIKSSKSEAGRKAIKERYDQLFETGNIAFSTFHQSLGYEDFIEGIKPLEPAQGQHMQYDIVDGIFKKICDRAEKCVTIDKTQGNSFDDALEQLEANWRVDPTMSFQLTRDDKSFTITEFKSKNIPFKKASGGTAHSLSKKTLSDLYLGIRKSFPAGLEIYYKSFIDKLKTYKAESAETSIKSDPKLSKFVLIVDEINRGNVSQIFGELITLLEPDKRIGEKEEIRLTLPYSKDEFGVPSNVYIIGTMNTADRSVEALDTALRRRFSFVPLMPDHTLLENTKDGIKLSELLKVLNKRLRVLKDNDHTIGHAWLLGVKKLEDLQKAFGDKILPLLQEYFFNDFEKLGLVLGDNFFEPAEEIDLKVFAKFKGGNEIADQYTYRNLYTLKQASKLSKEDFESLYNR